MDKINKAGQYDEMPTKTVSEGIENITNTKNHSKENTGLHEQPIEFIDKT